MNILHGHHSKILEFLKALGVPNSDRARGFKIEGNVNSIVSVTIEYLVCDDDLDTEKLKKFKVVVKE